MVSFTGYKQFGGKKKMQETEKEEDDDDETINLKKSSFMFAAQVLSLILLGNSTIYKDISRLLQFVFSTFITDHLLFPLLAQRIYRFSKNKSQNFSFQKRLIFCEWPAHHRYKYLNNLPPNILTTGILTQELDSVLTAKLPPGHTFSSYLAASYVQWVQAGGARAVPVIIGKDDLYYREVRILCQGLFPDHFLV